MQPYVGTWIQTNVNYSSITEQNFKVRRQTIIVTKEGDEFKFTDCISGDYLPAKEIGSAMSFYTISGLSLQIEDDSTLTVDLDMGYGTRTNVVLKKVSSDTSIILADVDFASPAPVSAWDQVCVETIQDLALSDEVKIRMVDVDNDVAVGLHAVFEGEASLGQHNYPAAVDDVTGYLESPLLDAEVYNPTGTIIVTEDATKDFVIDLLLENSEDSNMVLVDGIIKLDPTWFSFE